MKLRSLRVRLFAIILVPLVLLALVIGLWRINVARQTAQELFDRNLMLTAVAVSRDVALDDGDAISPETVQLLSETAGGPVRYHVYGPDGALVTGYAVPPIAPGQLGRDEAFAYYDAYYRGAPARVLRLKDEASIAGLSGTFTITVWQDLGVRNALVWDLALRSLAVMATLLTAVALLIWFGVRIGLKPLIELEDAISRRSPEELNAIQRPVPTEAQGIVARLNDLLGRMQATYEAQAAFVSDAAHQLRNPIAGMRALGESIQSAPSLDDAKSRADDLVAAAAKAGMLADRLLTLERARAETGTHGFVDVDTGTMVAETTAEIRARADAQGVNLIAELAGAAVLSADELMLKEALTNLIDNALIHGGSELTTIRVSQGKTSEVWTLAVENDGRTVSADVVPAILARFGQIEPGVGSGLGLSIADAVARRHGGRLEVRPCESGFRVEVSIPLPNATASDADGQAT